VASPACWFAVNADTVQDCNTTRRSKLAGGVRVRMTTDLVVDRRGDAWVGTLSLRALITRRGKALDGCRVKRISFTLG
jgi:hypothetical protein